MRRATSHCGFALHAFTTGGVGAAVLSTDRQGHQVALGTENGVLRVWDTAAIAGPRRLFSTGKPRRRPVFVPGRDAVFSINGRRGEIMNLRDGRTAPCGNNWPDGVRWLEADAAGDRLAFFTTTDANTGAGTIRLADLTDGCAFTDF